MKKLLLIALLVLSFNVSAQWYESYAFESPSGTKQFLSSSEAPVFAYEDNKLKILFPDFSIKTYNYYKTKGNYIIFIGKQRTQVYLDKKNKLVGSQNIGIWYLKEM